MGRKLGYYAALVLLLASLWGVVEAPGNLREATNGWQSAVGYGQLLYFVLGIGGGVGLWRRRPWAVPVAAAWTLAIAFVGSVASFAFHDPAFAEEGTTGAVLGAAISCVVVGSLVVWAARTATRSQPAASGEPVTR